MSLGGVGVRLQIGGQAVVNVPPVLWRGVGRIEAERADQRTIDALHKSLAGVVTVGQSFGGDLEAVTVHTGLLAARHVLGADLAIVTQGPGNLGTGTPTREG